MMTIHDLIPYKQQPERPVIYDLVTEKVLSEMPDEDAAKVRIDLKALTAEMNDMCREIFEKHLADPKRARKKLEEFGKVVLFSNYERLARIYHADHFVNCPGLVWQRMKAGTQREIVTHD